jgi:hypothetical protein
LFVLFRLSGIVFEIIEPRIRLWPGDDARDIRIDVRVTRTSFVATLLGFFAPNYFGLLLLSARPFAFPLTST